MCNLSVFGLVRGKFPELFAHAQTVDTRPLFPPTMRPGHKAIAALKPTVKKIVATASDRRNMVRLIFTSHECERCIYTPALYSGSYHAKKQSLAPFQSNSLLSGNCEATTFHLNHYPGKAGKSRATL